MTPDGWTKKFLSDLVSLEYGTRLPDTVRSGDGFSVYGSAGIVGKHREFLISGPGIIVGRKGSVGAVTWSNEPFWPIDTTYFAGTKNDVDLRWCYWLLSSLSLERLDSSTGVPGLNRNDAYRIHVVIPPLPEQRRIAEILDTADGAIQQTESLIAKLKAMKAGLLHDLLTRGIDENGQLRDPIAYPEQFKDSPLGQIPREWMVVGLEAFLRPQDGIKPGPFGSSLTKATYSDSGYRVYGQEQVIAGDLTVGDYLIPLTKFQELRSFTIQENDLLLTLVGTVGKVLVVPSQFHPGVINPRLIRLRPNPANGDIEFLKHLLTSSLVHQQLGRISQGGTMEVLSGIVLRRLLLCKPPIEEQKSITAVLGSHDARIHTEEAYLEKLKLQKKGLMHDLLTGKVRTVELATKDEEE